MIKDSMLRFLKKHKDLLMNNDLVGLFNAQAEDYTNGPSIIEEDLLTFLVDNEISLDQILTGFKEIPPYMLSFVGHPGQDVKDLQEYKVLDLSKYTNIKLIRPYAFDCCNVEEIILPKSVERVGDHAFNWCKGLKTMTFPEGVKEIGTHVFDSCFNLKTVYIPDSCEWIDAVAFYNCTNLEEISLPKRYDNKDLPELFELCRDLDYTKFDFR